MTTLIPKNGGKNKINGLDIKKTTVVIFDFKTLEILDTCDQHTKADEISCDLFRKGIDARSDALDFHREDLNAKNIIGLHLNQFQDFVENNKHPLI